jgi:hypothetical protein
VIVSPRIEFTESVAFSARDGPYGAKTPLHTTDDLCVPAGDAKRVNLIVGEFSRRRRHPVLVKLTFFAKELGISGEDKATKLSVTDGTHVTIEVAAARTPLHNHAPRARSTLSDIEASLCQGAISGAVWAR